MKNVIVILFFVLLVSACAHHDNQIEHHHHEDVQKASFNGKCAYNIENEKFDVLGKSEFSLTHNGTVYYFSSQQNLDLFKKDLPHSARRADRIWATHLDHGK